MTSSVFPLHSKVTGGNTACGNSVEASWPPLTPEHGFPSLLVWPGPRALPLGPLPVFRGAAILSAHTPFTKELKTAGTRMGARRAKLPERLPTVA